MTSGGNSMCASTRRRDSSRIMSRRLNTPCWRINRSGAETRSAAPFFFSSPEHPASSRPAPAAPVTTRKSRRVFRTSEAIHISFGQAFCAPPAFQRHRSPIRPRRGGTGHNHRRHAAEERILLYSILACRAVAGTTWIRPRCGWRGVPFSGKRAPWARTPPAAQAGLEPCAAHLPEDPLFWEHTLRIDGNLSRIVHNVTSTRGNLFPQ